MLLIFTDPYFVLITDRSSALGKLLGSFTFLSSASKLGRSLEFLFMQMMLFSPPKDLRVYPLILF